MWPAYSLDEDAAARGVSLCRNRLVLFLLSEKQLYATLDRASLNKLRTVLQEKLPKPSHATVKISQTSQIDLSAFNQR
jgi:hypothetical protein